MQNSRQGLKSAEEKGKKHLPRPIGRTARELAPEMSWNGPVPCCSCTDIHKQVPVLRLYLILDSHRHQSIKVIEL